MFHSARLKLTAWYLLIIMFISITFSMVIYRVLMGEVIRFEKAQRFRIEKRIETGDLFPVDTRSFHLQIPIPENTELIDEIRRRIIFLLTLVNGGILIVSGILGYALAGRTLKPIREMVKEQNRFISDASHELKTPLTSLKSAFEVYLRNSRPTMKEAKTLIRESIGEVDKLQSLSESLLQLAQYQNSQKQLYIEKLSLTTLLQEAIRKVRLVAQKKSIVIEKNIQDVEIEANKYSLVDLFVILLDNAIKYSPDKSRLIINTQKTDGSILVSVKDHGIGISKKDLPSIFERFYRADSARSKSESNGYGLGLAIAQKIVANHKGSIRAESILGKGSTFSVRLPLKQSSFS
ncbi:HAMP domain-containing histidine kinase [Candidatus Gottesmanbacteria bacterium]|nr:HAMP domain-containing histidine kinase [Candidatus Gottesmanbacteria bacterium]